MSLTAVKTKVQEYPVRVYAFGVYLLQMATAFGLDISAGQNAAIVGALGGLLAVVADKFTIPAFRFPAAGTDTDD